MTGRLEIVGLDQPEMLTLLDGLIRLRSKASLTYDLSAEAVVGMEIVYDEKLGRYVAHSVDVWRSGPGMEVTARVIREVRVQEAIVRVALSDLIEVLIDFDDPETARYISGEKWLADVRPMRESSLALEDAAVIYTIARLGNWPPLATVAKHLRISQSTATRLVAEARAKGHLSDG